MRSLSHTPLSVSSATGLPAQTASLSAPLPDACPAHAHVNPHIPLHFESQPQTASNLTSPAFGACRASPGFLRKRNFGWRALGIWGGWSLLWVWIWTFVGFTGHWAEWAQPSAQGLGMWTPLLGTIASGKCPTETGTCVCRGGAWRVLWHQLWQPWVWATPPHPSKSAIPNPEFPISKAPNLQVSGEQSQKPQESPDTGSLREFGSLTEYSNHEVVPVFSGQPLVECNVTEVTEGTCTLSGMWLPQEAVKSGKHSRVNASTLHKVRRRASALGIWEERLVPWKHQPSVPSGSRPPAGLRRADGMTKNQPDGSQGKSSCCGSKTRSPGSSQTHLDPRSSAYGSMNPDSAKGKNVPPDTQLDYYDHGRGSHGRLMKKIQKVAPKTDEARASVEASSNMVAEDGCNMLLFKQIGTKITLPGVGTIAENEGEHEVQKAQRKGPQMPSEQTPPNKGRTAAPSAPIAFMAAATPALPEETTEERTTLLGAILGEMARQFLKQPQPPQQPMPLSPPAYEEVAMANAATTKRGEKNRRHRQQQGKNGQGLPWGKEPSVTPGHFAQRVIGPTAGGIPLLLLLIPLLCMLFQKQKLRANKRRGDKKIAKERIAALRRPRNKAGHRALAARRKRMAQKKRAKATLFFGWVMAHAQMINEVGVSMQNAQGPPKPALRVACRMTEDSLRHATKIIPSHGSLKAHDGHLSCQWKGSGHVHENAMHVMKGNANPKGTPSVELLFIALMRLENLTKRQNSLRCIMGGDPKTPSAECTVNMGGDPKTPCTKCQMGGDPKTPHTKSLRAEKQLRATGVKCIKGGDPRTPSAECTVRMGGDPKTPCTDCQMRGDAPHLNIMRLKGMADSPPTPVVTTGLRACLCTPPQNMGGKPTTPPMTPGPKNSPRGTLSLPSSQKGKTSTASATPKRRCARIWGITSDEEQGEWSPLGANVPREHGFMLGYDSVEAGTPPQIGAPPTYQATAPVQGPQGVAPPYGHLEDMARADQPFLCTPPPPAYPDHPDLSMGESSQGEWASEEESDEPMHEADGADSDGTVPVAAMPQVQIHPSVIGGARHSDVNPHLPMDPATTMEGRHQTLARCVEHLELLMNEGTEAHSALEHTVKGLGLGVIATCQHIREELRVVSEQGVEWHEWALNFAHDCQSGMQSHKEQLEELKLGHSAIKTDLVPWTQKVDGESERTSERLQEIQRQLGICLQLVDQERQERMSEMGRLQECLAGLDNTRDPDLSVDWERRLHAVESGVDQRLRSLQVRLDGDMEELEQWKGQWGQWSSSMEDAQQNLWNAARSLEQNALMEKREVEERLRQQTTEWEQGRSLMEQRLRTESEIGAQQKVEERMTQHMLHHVLEGRNLEEKLRLGEEHHQLELLALQRNVDEERQSCERGLRTQLHEQEAVIRSLQQSVSELTAQVSAMGSMVEECSGALIGILSERQLASGSQRGDSAGEEPLRVEGVGNNMSPSAPSRLLTEEGTTTSVSPTDPLTQGSLKTEDTVPVPSREEKGDKRDRVLRKTRSTRGKHVKDVMPSSKTETQTDAPSSSRQEPIIKGASSSPYGLRPLPKFDMGLVAVRDIEKLEEVSRSQSQGFTFGLAKTGQRPVEALPAVTTQQGKEVKGVLAKDRNRQKIDGITRPRVYFSPETSPVADWEDDSGREEAALEAEKAPKRVSQKETPLRTRDALHLLEGKRHSGATEEDVPKTKDSSLTLSVEKAVTTTEMAQGGKWKGTGDKSHPPPYSPHETMDIQEQVDAPIFKLRPRGAKISGPAVQKVPSPVESEDRKQGPPIPVTGSQPVAPPPTKGRRIILIDEEATLSYIRAVKGRISMIRGEEDSTGEADQGRPHQQGNKDLAAALTAVLNPLMLQHQPAPSFSGKPQAWLTYRRLMEQWLSTMDPNRTAHDALLFQQLRRTLDPTSRLELDAAMASDPNLGFWDYWEGLKDQFEDELEFFNRQAWSKVRLELDRGEITCEGWRAYQAKYLKTALQVLDKTPQEEREKIFAQLPGSWRQRIINEESKRRGRQLWVRVQHPKLQMKHLQELLDKHCPADDGLDFTVHRTDIMGAFDIRCPNEQMHRKLKGADHTVVGGLTVRVFNRKIKMPTKDIFDFIMQRLKDMEEGRLRDEPNPRGQSMERRRDSGERRDQPQPWRRDRSQVRGVTGDTPNSSPQRRSGYMSAGSTGSERSQEPRKEWKSQPTHPHHSRRDPPRQEGKGSRSPSWNAGAAHSNSSSSAHPSGIQGGRGPRTPSMEPQHGGNRAQSTGRDMGDGKGKGKGMGRNTNPTPPSRDGKGGPPPHSGPPCAFCLDKLGLELYHAPQSCWGRGPCRTCLEKEGRMKFHSPDHCWYAIGRPSMSGHKGGMSFKGGKGGQKGR